MSYGFSGDGFVYFIKEGIKLLIVIGKEVNRVVKRADLNVHG